MIAMLGMYDMPAIRPANDRYWQAIRAHLGYGPDHLTRAGDHWDIWQAPDLLLAQTCGMPYRTRLHGRVRRVGTPDYGLPGCPPGYYYSCFVVRADDSRAELQDFAGSKFAYNDPHSQSGWAAPIHMANTLGIGFSTHAESGGHAFSAQYVADGRADIAGIDAVTWALMQANDPIAKTLKVIAGTPPTPGLPYITALQNDPAILARAVRHATESLSLHDRAALHLNGFIDIPDDAYLGVPTPAGPQAV